MYYTVHIYIYIAAEHIYINEKHGKYLHHNDEAIVLYVVHTLMTMYICKEHIRKRSMKNIKLSIYIVFDTYSK